MDTGMLFSMGLVFSSVGSLAALYFWKQAKDIQKKWLDSLAQLEQLQLQDRKVLQKAEHYKALSKSEQAKQEELAKTMSQLQQKLHAQQEATQLQVAAKDQALHTTENRLAHFQEQTESLTHQLKDMVLERQQIRNQVLSECTKKESELRKQWDDSFGQLKSEKQALQKDLTQRTKELNALKFQQSQSVSVDPKVLQQAQKKLKQYYFMFKGLDGQKQMLAERLENWEQALRMLATAVWVEKHSASEAIPKDIGALVYHALQLMKCAHLVNDDEPIQLSEGLPSQVPYDTAEHTSSGT
jgi:DNA repair exonuclease SbcCD ATPase subunit